MVKRAKHSWVSEMIGLKREVEIFLKNKGVLK